MKNRFWLITGSVLVLALVILGVVLFSGKVRITQNLSQGEVTNDGYWYVSDFLSGEGENGYAHAGIGGYSRENICYITVWLAHEEGTIVDEISLQFNPIFPQEALALAQGGWYLAEYHATSDARGVVYRVPDTGMYGKGTQSFKFLLQKDMFAPGDTIYLNINFTMHKDGLFKMTKQHGQGYISFEIP